MSDDRLVPIASLRLHPDAERVPMPDATDLRTLRTSLQENGQQDPVDATDAGVILDGRTRWVLLKELGAESIRVRPVDIPEGQQTGYIIDRALARRHLTMAQKQALNALLRAQVVEVRAPSKTSANRGIGPMLIGHSQTERAAKLGVERQTIQNWDSLVDKDLATSEPTHAIDKRGRPQPLHKAVATEPKVSRALPRPTPLRKARPIPGWSRQFSMWCRSHSRPEDRDFLRRLDRELHAALDRNGISCEKEVAS
jgi:hypothetical protein